MATATPEESYEIVRRRLLNRSDASSLQHAIW